MDTHNGGKERATQAAWAGGHARHPDRQMWPSSTYNRDTETGRPADTQSEPSGKQRQTSRERSASYINRGEYPDKKLGEPALNGYSPAVGRMKTRPPQNHRSMGQV